MLHDERNYEDPHVFRPERFLTPDGSQLDPNVLEPTAAFGFGRRYVFTAFHSRSSGNKTYRRICPGRHMATSMLYIAVASILSVFEISKARDEDGNPVTPSGKYTSCLVSHPVPFKCTIKPRGAEAERVIMAL
jgi:cytochrome P450